MPNLFLHEPFRVAELDQVGDIGMAQAVQCQLPVQARILAATWGPRERFIVERLDGTTSAERIAAEWTDRGDKPMIAAQVKVFVDQLLEQGLAEV